MSRPPQNPIPQQGMNPIMLMQQYQKFKEDFYAGNENPDPKAAVMEQVQGNMNNPALQQAMMMAKLCGFK